MENNLPPIPPVYVGRERETAQIERAIADPDINIVTIYGVGGIGKTTLARFVARRLRKENRFPGRIVWVDCYSENTLSKILTIIAQTLGVQSASITHSRLRDVVSSYLRSNPTLLIFDSYEMVADNDEILSFIGRLPKQTKVLIISRDRVQVPGRAITVRLESFTEAESLELLKQSVGSKQWVEVDKETLRKIHHHTGGLPVFVSVVSDLLEQGWTLDQLQEEMSAEKVVERLLDRQVETAFAEREQRFLEALSIFAHPVKGDVVAAVAEMEDWRSTAQTLSRVSFIAMVDGKYAIHPVMRTFLRDRIRPEQLEVLQRRMTQYYLAYIEKFQYDFDQIEREWLNIQYASEVAYQNKFWQLFIALILRLGEFTTAHGYENEYQSWLNQAIEASDKIGDVNTRAALLHNLGVQYQQRRDWNAAARLYEQSLTLKEAIGDTAAESATLTNLGSIYRSQGDIRSALTYYEQALRISQEIGDPYGEGENLANLGLVYADLGHMEQAIAYHEQAFKISLELNHPYRQANILANLGSAYANLGHVEQAIAYHKQALGISQEIGDRHGEGANLANLGSTYANLGRVELAIAHYEQALRISQEIGDRHGEGANLANLGSAYANLGRVEQAIAHYEQALRISQEIRDRHREANVLGNLGSVYTDLGHMEQAIAYYEQALAISREIGDQRGEASLYGNLGTTYSNLYSITGDISDVQNALDFYNQALQTFRPEVYPLEYAALQNNIANIYANLQTGDRAENIEQAIMHYQEALKIRTLESSPVDWAATQSNLASAFSQRVSGERTGNLRQAIASYEQALRVYTKKNYPNNWLRTTINLSTTYAEVEDWPKAREKAAAILQSFQSTTTVDPDSLTILLPWYQRLGELAIQNRDEEFAARIFAEAAFRFELQGEKVPNVVHNSLVELREKLRDDRFGIIWAEAQRVLTPILAQTLHKARELMSQEHFSAAVDKLSNALSLISETDRAKEVRRQKATILFLRGFCLRKQELWEQALRDQEQAFQLFEEVRDYVGEAQTFLEMGHLFEVMNNYEDARLHYMDAYRLYRRAKNRYGMALASENLGRLEYRVGMFSQAVQDLEEARKLYISVGNRTKATTIESDLEAAKASLDHQANSEKQRG